MSKGFFVFMERRCGRLLAPAVLPLWITVRQDPQQPSRPLLRNTGYQGGGSLNSPRRSRKGLAQILPLWFNSRGKLLLYEVEVFDCPGLQDSLPRILSYKGRKVIPKLASAGRPKIGFPSLIPFGQWALMRSSWLGTALLSPNISSKA